MGLDVLAVFIAELSVVLMYLVVFIGINLIRSLMK